MNKSIKLRISIQNWIDLGGDINKLIGKTVYYNSYDSIWFVHEVIYRTITRGKNKGKEEIVLKLKYDKNNDYVWSIKKFTNYYIEAPVMLVPSKDLLLNKVDSILTRIKNVISEFNIEAIKLKYLL